MMNKESKKRRLYLCWLAVAVLVVVFTVPAFAQEDPNAPLPYDPNMPEETRLPGTVEGTGTYFEVTDSNYLNITLESSEVVHLMLESVPEMVVMDINATNEAASTQITLTGFPPSTTYYKYEDDYHNEVTFTTDDNGSYRFAHDLTQPHLVFIQPNAGTIFIPQDTSVGTWDSVNRIYTLTTDVYETIQIDEDNLTLDGAGHTVSGSGTGYGIYLPFGRTGVTIKNVNVQQFTHGIFLSYSSSNNTLTANTANSNNSRGIHLYNCSNNTLTGNTASNNSRGIFLSSSSNNTLTGNTASNNNISGIYLDYSNGNTLTGNTMSGNRYNFAVNGWSDADFDNDIDTTNTVDGKPVYYVKNAVGTLYDSTTNAGVFYAINCENITIKDLRLTNNRSGVFLWNTHNSTIENVFASNNQEGIALRVSTNNTLTGNTACNNAFQGIDLRHSGSNILTGNTASDNAFGIYLWASSSTNNTLAGNTASSNSRYGICLYASSSNTLTGNNFISNPMQACVTGGSGNVFNLDWPIGGNYWSDWTGPDNDGDGFVDYPYVFAGGQDDFPWTRQDGWVAAGVTRAGTDVVVQPEDQTTGQTPVTLTFDEVTEVGVTTVTSTTPGEQQGAPEGFRVGQPPTIFNISTTATFTGYVLICINYSGISFQDESTLELFHFENGEWVLLPTVLDTENDIICGEVTSLSPFAIFEPDKLPVSIDIKPGSYPNAINLGSYGLVPVAILSFEDFDATDVDPDTVELAGSGVEVRGKSNKFMAHAEDVNGDGLVDLLLQVATQNLDPDSFQDGYAVLTGETYDGVSIEGEDEITIVPPEP